MIRTNSKNRTCATAQVCHIGYINHNCVLGTWLFVFVIRLTLYKNTD